MNLIHFRLHLLLFKKENELYSVVMEPQVLSSAQQRKSAAILDAARNHFAAHGFEATKLSEVAKDSGVAVGTIYLRYKSKTELLSGVLDRVEESFCEAMDTPDVWALPFPQRFDAIISAILLTARKEKGLDALMALAAFAPQSSASQKQRMLSKIEQHLEDGVTRGEVRADVDLALVARMAHGLVDAAMRELTSNPARDPAVTIRHISDVFTRWLGDPVHSERSA